MVNHDKQMLDIFNSKLGFSHSIYYLQHPFLYGGVPINTTPTYNPNNIQIGVVIGTYGSTDIIRLQLHYLCNINKISKVLVVDDSSDQTQQLQELCNQYNVEFISTPYKMPRTPCVGCSGDMYCFSAGLKWAKQHKLDVVVKLSRRFIPCFEWVNSFKKLIIESDGITFTSYCDECRMGFRCECCGMNVNAWSHDLIVDALDTHINNDIPVLAEYWFHSLSRYLNHFNRSKKWFDYETKQNMPYEKGSYVVWKDVMGISRCNTKEKAGKVLWHDYITEQQYKDEINLILGIEAKNIDWCK